MKQYISNILLLASAALSTDPQVLTARREGVEKIREAKAEAKELKKSSCARRREIKNLHKQERAAVKAKQKSEFSLLVEEQKLAQQAQAKVIESRKDEMIADLHKVRRDQSEKIARANAYVYPTEAAAAAG